MGAGGRPVVFTPEVQDAVIESIMSGVTIGNAMKAVGLTYQTYNDYWNEDPEFRAKVEAARKEQLANLKNLARKKLWDNIAEGNQRAIEKALNALEPEIWNVPNKVESTTEIRGDVNHGLNLNCLTAGELEALVGIALKLRDTGAGASQKELSEVCPENDADV